MDAHRSRISAIAAMYHYRIPNTVAKFVFVYVFCFCDKKVKLRFLAVFCQLEKLYVNLSRLQYFIFYSLTRGNPFVCGIKSILFANPYQLVTLVCKFIKIPKRFTRTRFFRFQNNSRTRKQTKKSFFCLYIDKRILIFKKIMDIFGRITVIFYVYIDNEYLHNLTCNTEQFLSIQIKKRFITQYILQIFIKHTGELLHSGLSQ